ncbi:MAG: hypothetical protein Q9187_009373, partial [Circinaria calcarea]
TTNARTSAFFGLDTEFISPAPPDQFDWLWMLSDALMQEGFRCEQGWMMQRMGMRVPEALEARERARDEKEAREKQEAAEKQEALKEQA